jgi:D-alanine--poly(phosphoribitol) ligase subunit 1
MGLVWDAVAARAAQHPSTPAVCGETNWTYQELEQRVSMLAGAIQSRIGPGRIVAAETTSPAATAVAMLAAERAGCPFLPLGADIPPVRREFILQDADPALVVGESLTTRSTGACQRPAEEAAGTAYLIYTSGSTGRPKGVVVPSVALLSRLHAMACVPGFRPGDSFFAMTAPSFDISIAEILLPLTAGGRFVDTPAGTRLDPEIFAAAVRAHRPDVIQATPSFWRLTLAWGWSGATESRIWCGGEALTPGLVTGLLPKCAELWNVYGPTEATIWATAALIESADRIDLGAPLPGARLCLEGSGGKPVTAPDETGEILLYGEGLARGYLNRAELTALQFRDCDTPDGRQRCYRTGDLARYRGDGTLQFIGRNDGQVKLRGHRVELGELEAVAEEHPAIHEAVATLRNSDDAAKAYIALLVVADESVSPRQLRGWLAERLPASMRPSRISMRQALPRTASGKLDRVALANEI